MNGKITAMTKKALSLTITFIITIPILLTIMFIAKAISPEFYITAIFISIFAGCATFLAYYIPTELEKIRGMKNDKMPK